MSQTYVAKPAEIERQWYVVDAKGQTLGRLASRIARILRGKHKPIYTPHVDCGDYVIVINAGGVRLTGRKTDNKVYYHHTGYPGGLRSVSAAELMKEKPEKMIKLAVRGMLPKNKLGRRMLKRLRVYNSPDHPHEAQQPQPLELGE